MLPGDNMLKEVFKGLDLQGLTPEKLYRLAHCRIMVLDVDDTLYPIDDQAFFLRPGIHDLIKQNIIRTFNEAPDQFKKAVERKIKKNSFTIDINNLSEKDLGIAFPFIVQVIHEMYPNNFIDLLNHMYGDFYDESITPDIVLTSAIEDALPQADIKTYLWTNGPSSEPDHPDMHVQKILRQLGFLDQTIEGIKPYTYDLIKSTQDGFGKPAEENWENMLRIITQQNEIDDYNQILVIDDSLKNLAYPNSLGNQTLWIQGSSKKPPSPEEINDAKGLGIERITDLGTTLNLLAEARQRLIEANFLSASKRNYDSLDFQAGP